MSVHNSGCTVGNLLKDNQSVTASKNPWAPWLHLKCFVCVQYCSLCCSKIDKMMQERLVLETHRKAISSAYTASNPRVYAREKRRPWRTFSPHPPPSQCCLFLCGVVSFPGVGSAPLRQVGRGYQSTCFNFLRLCRLALFSFSLCCVGSHGSWDSESLWVLLSCSGLLKKCRLSTGKKVVEPFKLK